MSDLERRPSPADPDAWVSISRYAELYGVHRQTVAKWVELRIVVSYRKGAIVRVLNVRPDAQPTTDGIG